MPSRDSRIRAVSSGSVVIPGDEDVATLIQDLNDLELTQWSHFEIDLAESGCLQQLRFMLKDEGQKHNPRDSFRRAQGFQAVLRSLQCLADVLNKEVDEKGVKAALQILAQVLAVLEAALERHTGNNKYFRVRIEGGGWKRMKVILQDMLNLLLKHNDKEKNADHFFGVLFATATGNEAVSDVYLSIRKTHGSRNAISNVQQQKQITTELHKVLTTVQDLVLPDMLSIAVAIWRQYLEDNYPPNCLNIAFALSIEVVLDISRENVVAAHTANLLSTIRPLLFEGGHSAEEKAIYRRVALRLCEEGVQPLEDVQYYFSKASTDSAAAAFLLEMIRASRQPPGIQFDLARHGSSSIELANLRKAFPPADTSGYSLTLWARFDHFDDHAHTTLFGAFDASNTCFVLAYLEKDSKHLILQTAVRGSRPSVRFKAVKFQTGRWYHICVTHKKPKAISSSRASLFVDGEFVEQVKATFPSNPPVDRASGTVKIQAFLGTPQDLSPNTGTLPCFSRWSLANAMLVGDVLSDDFVAITYHLGPGYYGNLQDCLGSFQTYAASTALNLRNESLNPGKEETSDLVMAIRHRASSILPETNILLNVSPAAVLDGDDRNNIDESQLIRSLSKQAAKNLFGYIRSGANAIAINGAVPAINDALVQTNGVLLLLGEPLVTVPQSLDDAVWRLGNCAPIGLGLVSKARTTEDVATAVEILLLTVKQSWRNSEVMERQNGYGILSNLIREKLASSPDTYRGGAAIPTPKLDRSGLGLRLLQLILSFVGYDGGDETKCILKNPLAYKILLIDTDVWRCHSPESQELFFQQISAFAVKSYHSTFNLKRLNRMRVTKRLLEALKGEFVSRSAMPLYSATLRALLPSAMSAEVLRSVALFVTYSIHKHNTNNRQRKHLQSESRSRGSSGSAPSSPTGSSSNWTLTQFEIGVEVLRVYSDMLCMKGDTSMIKKFAKTVTNKWLLYLLSESSPEVVVLSVLILARLLVVHGEAYVKKFKEKSGGFTIMCHRLKRWWHLPALWPACFAILFGVDVAELDLNRSFDLFSFVDLFDSHEKYTVTYPEMFEVITSMLQSGLRTIASSKSVQPSDKLAVPANGNEPQPPQRLSMSTIAPPNPFLTLVTTQNIETFSIIVRFLADLQSRSAKFRDFAAQPSYVQDLLYVLFPVVVGSDIVDATVELNARDSVLSFEGMDAVVHPLTKASPLLRSSIEESVDPPPRGKAFRRGSSFVLVSREQAHQAVSTPKSRQPSPHGSLMSRISDIKTENHVIVQGILEIIVAMFVEQILARKDFPGLGLFLRTPPGFVEHQHYFASWILRNTVSELSNAIALDQKVLSEPKVLTNMARFVTHLGEALFEGWFVGGAESVLDLAGSVLEYLQRSDIAQLKSVRLCAQAVSTIRTTIFRVVLLSLSQVQDTGSLVFLAKLSYWQNVLLSSEETKKTHLQHLCFLLYGNLISPDKQVSAAAANLWRIILVQKSTETASIFGQADSTEQSRLISSFEKLVELDNDTFLIWVDNHREELDSLFYKTLARSWGNFVDDENKRTEEAARSRISRRREKLKTLAREEADREEVLRRHEITFDHWTNNIYSSEHLKYQRLMQDQQDDRAYSETLFRKMLRELGRSTGLFMGTQPAKWRLDQTEGRNRMRMRLVEDSSKEPEVQQPKRKGSDIPTLRVETKCIRPSSSEQTPITATTEPVSAGLPPQERSGMEPFPDVGNEDTGAETEAAEIEESFEMIEDPNADEEGFEDKNRKVMRSLHRGDQVKHVANISRVVGLEAIEGLLILGKDYIYLIDNFFQRADGEIVKVWQAPADERDPYVRIISGRDLAIRKPQSRTDHETRSWKWSEVISVSKRRFLFRDVAIEIFFGDGRSYLLTMISMNSRNDLYSRINSKAPQYGSAESPQSEHAWRYETLKSPEEETQSFGSRFGSLFSQSSGFTATRKWQKGEMSNFHYLMLMNTMAGRTYNDLTQYPVFPWVIADYTSKELDLTNPKTFRDLSKPMGCQTLDREAEFKERYKSFAEMGDHNAPAFHYGTHYSSAMIVTSYLIRLQPFVKSYLLLQGGTFDHADRMFFSIEQAWRSASRVNMTDVRELTPEFFYLPEFLTNPNGYDFGMRQASSKSIGDVELPPWAKGDPRIFIAKQREALESPFVSKNLHKWIDLIFGFKQKGEAALEAVNVFHHLSYQGAKDLDTIDDSVERLATIGIIHNFGQTPYQIIQRAHPARDHIQHKYKRIDTAAESLTRLPSTLLDSGEMVASLSYSWKVDKLLCSGAFRLNIPPNYDKYMEWGFFDGSIRFYSAETRKSIGLFEHLHIGQLSCALFADSKTLITAGIDCTVAVWSVITSGKNVDLQPKSTLFGHHRPVTNLALSRSFNALLSASACGELRMWDLNRCEFVREIQFTSSNQVGCTAINDVTGNIVVCHGSHINMYSINGDLLLTQDTSDRGSSDDTIISVACYEGAGSEWLERDILFTGHKRGVVRVWSRIINPQAGAAGEMPFELELLRQLNHVDPSRDDGGNVSAGISCILALPQVVYTGDEDGRVCEWNCVQRH